MRHYQPRHMDVYHNGGYLGDERGERDLRDEERDQRDRHLRSRRDSKDSRSYAANGQAHHQGRHGSGQQGGRQPPPAQFSPGAPNFRYAGEMKFP